MLAKDIAATLSELDLKPRIIQHGLVNGLFGGNAQIWQRFIFAPYHGFAETCQRTSWVLKQDLLETNK